MADCVAKVFLAFGRETLIQDRARTSNNDSKEPTLRSDCYKFLFHRASSATFATQSAKSGHSHCSKKAPLFDHLVGAGEQRWRDVEAKRFGGLEVDHKLVPGRVLHREVTRLLTLENAIDVAGGATVLIDEVGPVGHETAIGDEVSIGIDCRQAMFGRKRDDQLAMNRRPRA